MAMDFFQHQEDARRKTGWLLAYLVLAVLGIVAAIYVVLVGMLQLLGAGESDLRGLPWWQPEVLLWVAGGTVALVVLGAVSKTIELRRGGGAVAEALGGRPVSRPTADPAEQRLLNVVEEIAIASGVPAPAVYVLDQQPGINAFAAGFSTVDYVVAVTRGCMEELEREELQGVIAHEFSHLLNGDCRLNLRLLGVLHGILIIALVGYRVFAGAGRGMRFTRSSRKGGGAGIVLAVLAFSAALMIIGYIGVFFAKLIKSAVSRQREFLADAAAVQFTRNADGLGNALKRIGGWDQGSRLQHPRAQEVSHMFFANGLKESFLGMMATHPPLTERIQRLDPSWDGDMTPRQVPAAAPHDDIPELPGVAAVAPVGEPSAPAVPAPPRADGATSFAATAASVVERVGAPGPEHVAYAKTMLARCPERLLNAAREPYSARAIVYALLLDNEEPARGRQVAHLKAHGDLDLLAEAHAFEPEMEALGRGMRLPLLDLTLPALREMSPKQCARFRDTVQALIRADDRVRLFEYTLGHTLLRHLGEILEPGSHPQVRHTRLDTLLPACGELLTTLAGLGHREDAAADRAFHAAYEELGVSDAPAYAPPEKFSRSRLDDALHACAEATPALKQRVLRACVACIESDGRITINEAELLRAVADAMDCPLPPFLPDPPTVQ